ncbi:2Fe-2S iron-sulfur cluster-binding protein [Marinibactrum halimedae]|uniref:Oxidoreductase n=1 Tax=Marinibactrum halimedae TaxID=1444977 RepID=A0AA37TCD9_9GAMM|nr:2Fe-2S iron-sulfur cluster binding domain-containing protein [Marinibactrum halimedae]MCD9458929.1 2Fe-2S iron-sulfur cluster binding domain-containing protein [Marinibactrum halimedae]GLS27776.1 oxidoreductase [Marinibactrum halimedae]
MKAHSSVQMWFDDKRVEVDSAKTILANLLDAGIPVPYGCGNGLCCACMLQAEGTLPQEGQDSLTPSEKASGKVLICKAYPPTQGELRLSLPGQSTVLEGCITEKTLLPGGVIRLSLQPTSHFTWEAGQFVTLFRPDGVGRAYSIASVMADGVLTFHIRHRLQGQFSDWLKIQGRLGETVRLSTPQGHFVLSDTNIGKPHVFIATGTGIGAVMAVVRTLLAQDPNAAISVYWAMGEVEHFYPLPELILLLAKYRQLRFIPVVRRGVNPSVDFSKILLPLPLSTPAQKSRLEDIRTGEVESVLRSDFSSLSGHCVYLCGSPTMVEQLSRLSFMRGVAKADIYSDAFLKA